MDRPHSSEYWRIVGILVFVAFLFVLASKLVRPTQVTIDPNFFEPSVPAAADELSAGIMKDIGLVQTIDQKTLQSKLAMSSWDPHIKMEWTQKTPGEAQRLRLWYEPADYEPGLYTRTDCEAPRRE